MPLQEDSSGWITALDADTGKVRWRFHADAPVIGGVTPTAGGIVMAGDNAGNFYALDSNSGSVLKKIATGGSVSGGVITFAKDSKQYVALTSGNNSIGVFGAIGRPSIIVMSVNVMEPSTTSISTGPDSVRGKGLFLSMCIACHGSDGKAIDGFDLSTIKSRMNFSQLITWLKAPAPPMPRVFPEPLDADDQRDIADIAAYLNGPDP
jgi:alcohol dehydrogenase (cytochrome c)